MTSTDMRQMTLHPHPNPLPQEGDGVDLIPFPRLGGEGSVRAVLPIPSPTEEEGVLLISLAPEGEGWVRGRPSRA